MLINLKKGLDLPISGAPKQVIHAGSPPKRVALLGDDYIGLKPKLQVEEGQKVKIGQTLFVDKQTAVPFTAPAGGTIERINRGAKRALRSVVINVETNLVEANLVEANIVEANAVESNIVEGKTVEDNSAEKSRSYSSQQIQQLTAEALKSSLLSSGLWTAFRARPFNKIPHPDTVPHSLFITAMDTNPLAPDPGVIINAYQQDFGDGLTVLSRLFSGPIFLCQAAGAALPTPEISSLRVATFTGPHPAGLAGTHIHFLDPVAANKTVWHIGYQDVIGIGKLFTQGEPWNERIVAVAGPGVSQPRLMRVPCGVNVTDLLQDELKPGNQRIISGSVLSGRIAVNEAAYLGRYHNQISVIEEVTDHAMTRESQRKRFSIHSPWFRLPHSLFKSSQYNFNSGVNGAQRVMFPVGDFERVIPLNVLPTPLLKALLTEDVETAASLGCLELDEEDLALCSYVCCGKNDYGAALRSCLDELERESEQEIE